MRDTEEVILNLFKNNPSRELNAEFLAREIYPQEYSKIENAVHSPDKTSMHEAKREKFQLHRKLLYYINKLIESRIIKVSRTAEKGEKYFILNSDEGDMIIEKGYKRILVSKPVITSTYIDKYELRNVMKIYEPDSWVNRFNSVLLECPKNQELGRIYEKVSECMTSINDVLALNEFENILNTTSDRNLGEFIERMARDSANHDKTVALIINLAQANSNIFGFIENFARINPQKMNIIFNLAGKDLQKHSKVLEFIIEKFSESKIKINFKNNTLASAPYFKGRAGIYTFDDKEWDIYEKRFKGNTIGISCSQSQIVMNINKFFEEYDTDTEFRQAILDGAKTLLVANNIQRRKSNDYFRNINAMNQPNAAEFYKFSRNYIRFWNYDWHKEMDENKNLIELIRSTKELVDNFCYSEETIFKSCGIPIRFRIAFSSAFRNFDQKFMGERDYRKATINKAEEYYSSNIKEFLHVREKMFEVFDGGDRLRIFRKSGFAIADIMHELEILLTAYKIPFFTYDFSGLKGVVKLTNFM